MWISAQNRHISFTSKQGQLTVMQVVTIMNIRKTTYLLGGVLASVVDGNT
jgi:hypothetical protein